MPKTLGTLKNELRHRLDESSATFWTDEQLRTWLIDGARDVARRAEILQTTANVTITANVQEYTMATDIVRVYRAEWRPTGQSTVYPLEYRDFNSMDAVWWTQQTVTTGTPQIYTMWGFPPSLKLVLYPTPSVAGVVKVFYYKLPTTLAVSDTSGEASNVDIPEGWHDLLLMYAEYMALRKDRNPTWQEAKQLYEQALDDLMTRTQRWTDQAGMVTMGQQFIPHWLYEMEG